MSKDHQANGRIGKAIKVGRYTKNLPNYINNFNSKNEYLEVSLKKQAADLDSLNKKVSKLSEGLKAVERLDNKIDDAISDLQHQALLSSRNDKQNTKAARINDTIADNSENDKFYKEFEDRFRGTEDNIKNRLKEYMPYLNRLTEATKLLPVIDLGCGRGEFLAVVEQAGMKAIGVDMNASMVDHAKKLGYQAVKSDALSYLSNLEPNSCSIISGFHIVEHIPFDDLLKVFDECYRTINRDGFILFETPNPNNLTIGAANFYVDPSHIKPIPPDLLSYALESRGFNTKILPLHPVMKDIDHPDPIVRDMMGMVYGPQDYSVFASKKPFELI